MAKTEDKSNKLYGTGVGDNNITPVTNGKINVGNKLATLNPNDPTTLVDAFNIDWASGQYSYDNSGNIIQSTGHFVEILNEKATTSAVLDINNTINSRIDNLDEKPAGYYQIRYLTVDNTVDVANNEAYHPSNYHASQQAQDPKSIQIQCNGPSYYWVLTPVYEAGKSTWMSSRKVAYTKVNGSWTEQWDAESSWSTPIKMGEMPEVPRPIQNVLMYVWTSSNTDAPTVDVNSQNPGVNWQESPGNPSGSNIYLWMIQGQRQNNQMIEWDTDAEITTMDAYWTTPVCLSGKDGEPGKDGDDLEFIYKRFETVPTFSNDNDDNPANWAASQQDMYCGPDNYEWEDHPQGVNSTYKYEYCAYRRKTGTSGNKTWTTFSAPFAWSIYGENGVDGDGVEYIYSVQQNNSSKPTVPEFDLDPTSFQKSEVYDGTIWHDDPQNLDSVNQKYQYVSTRKYKKITSDNKSDISESFTGTSYTMGGYTVHVGDKIWFPYSTPELWNWYVKDGTSAPQIAMVYRRTNSMEHSPTLPEIVQRTHKTRIYSYVNAVNSGWASSPGISIGSKSYLWMSSIYYTNLTTGTDNNNKPYIDYTIKDGTQWQTPICLTGESGKDGEDGTDIEFIYYRTADDNVTPQVPPADANYQLNDWPFIGTEGTSYYTTYGAKTLYDRDHDTWSDNPLGITTTYDYEYAAIRKKENGTWGAFCSPFLWSKYGEDGVDGDGVEYIFYRSTDENDVQFVGNINPTEWDDTNDIYQQPEYKGEEYQQPGQQNWWNDDPSGVDPQHRYEYVSTRKFRYNEAFGEKRWSEFSAPVLWSHYAVDGLAVNLTLESDNDMMAVAVDDNGIVTRDVTSIATFALDHNTRSVSTSYYSMNISNSNLTGSTFGYDTDNGITYSYLRAEINNTTYTLARLQLTNSAYTLSTSIPEGFNMSGIDNELRITSCATITDNSFDTTGSVENGTTKIFTNKVEGLHVNIDDIYQLQLDKQVIKDLNGDLETVTVKLKSLTSNDVIDNTEDAIDKHLYVFYDNCKCDTSAEIGQSPQPTSSYGTRVVPIGKALSLRNSSDVIEHTFTLYYDIDDTYGGKNQIGSSDTQNSSIKVNNGNGLIQTIKLGHQTPYGTLIDTEVVSRVYDGANGNPGTDSKSQEYIYFVTDDISYFENGNHANLNPNNWNTHENVNIEGTSYYAYNTDDFPFVNGQTSYLGWEDTHIGISEEHPYQFISTREYNTTTKEWGKFSIPTCSHNWGHSGEDGQPGSAGPFKSTVFTRKSTTPATPSGGTYSSPIPTDKLNNVLIWSDGIPEGTDPIWASSATFNSTDTTGPTGGTGGWSTPRLMADTELYDVEFSPYTNNDNNSPAQNPTDSNRHGASAANQRWFDPKDDFTLPSGIKKIDENGHIVSSGGTTPTWSDMVWRAEREKTPGTNTYSNWTITRIKGEKGNPGDNGNSAYAVDFTNDQINFAVDENGKINNTNSQVKTSYINFINCKYDYNNAQNLTLSNPNGWTTYSYNNINNYYNEKIYWADGNGYPIWINSYNNLIALYTSEYDNSTVVSITAATLNDEVNVIIPEEGIDISIKIPIILSDGSSTTIDKVIRICGQHTAQDGENAVTLELNPSNNAIYKDNTIFSPSSISVQLTKYNGDVPEVLSYSTFSSNYLVSYLIEGHTTIRYYTGDSIDCSTARSGYPIDGNITLRLHKTTATNSSIIDRETIPLINRGEAGAQGFTGPVVRYCGEWKASNDGGQSKYYNGLVNANATSVPNVYYKDIVYHDGHYYTPKASSTYDTTGDFINIGYISNSSSWTSANWVEATQFDFVATKLLYADQALINQISSHDFIATTQDGTPVAGMTSGKKDYGNNNSSLSLLNNANNGNVDTGGVTGSSSDTLTDTSHVRIFAGQIWNNDNSYSLTYAPFNVRQDGTAYMSKANIVGDVNIGGNVNISGTSVKVAGDISAKSLALSRNNTFFYNTYTILPNFNENENRVIYAMYYKSNNRVIMPVDSYLWMATTNGIDRTDNAGDNYIVDDKALYTFYSGYGDHPTRPTGNCKYWIMTKSELVIKSDPPQGETIVIPPSITYNLSADQLERISISIINIEKTPSSGAAWDTQIAQISLEGFNDANIPNTVTRTFGTNNQESHQFTNTKEIHVGITVPDNLIEISSEPGFTGQELSVQLINSYTKYDGNTLESGYNITIGTTDEIYSGTAGCFYFYYQGYNGINSSDDLIRELEKSLTINYISIIYKA